MKIFGLVRFRFWLCILVLSLGLLPSATRAQTPLPSSPAPRASAPILVDARTLFQIGGADSEEAQGRADLINGRLQRLIAREAKVPRFAPGDIIQGNSGPTIPIGGEEVLTVTQADALQNNQAASDLAIKWGYTLSDAVRGARAARRSPVNSVLVTVATSVGDLIHSIVAWLPRLLSALLLLILFWLFASGARSLTRRAVARAHFDPNVEQLALVVSFYGVWALGLLAILSALGVNSASIAATLGVSGFVLGFAFKDVLSHFFAGLMLLSGRQFTIGGQIQVGEHEGVVESIDLRALRLRLYDNRLVTIPNGDVFNSAVISNTSNPTRRRAFQVPIAIEDDARAAIDLALQTVNSVEGVLADPAANVVASDLNARGSLGAASLELSIYFHVASDNPRYFQILSECILRVKDEFERAGITIAGQPLEHI